MKNKIPHNSSPSNQESIDSYDFLSNSASAQDCTGLIPSAPVNHYLPPQIKNAQKKTEDWKHP